LAIFRILVGNRYVWQGGQTENQGGQTKKYGALCRILSNKCLPTLAWNPAGAPTRFAQYFALFWSLGLRLGYL